MSGGPKQLVMLGIVYRISVFSYSHHQGSSSGIDIVLNPCSYQSLHLNKVFIDHKTFNEDLLTYSID